MEPARGEARWLALDDAHVPALGSEADSFDYGGQAVLVVGKTPEFSPHYSILRPPAT